MKQIHTVLLLLIVIIYLFLTVGSAVSESLTFDERTDMEVGVRAWYEKKLNIEPYNPILIRMISTLPVILGTDNLFPYGTSAFRFLPSRMVTVLFGAGILLVTYKFAAMYFSHEIGLYAVLFLAVEPNFLAHTHYVTHDAGATFFFVIAYFALFNFLIYPAGKSLVFFSIYAGLSWASKITTIPYLCLSGIGLLFYLKRNRTIEWLGKRKKMLAAFLVLSVLTIWTTYLFQFDVVIAPSERSGRFSDRLIAQARNSGNTFLFNTVEFLRTTPVPLGTYTALLKNNILRSQLNGNTFFLGEFREKSQWYFLPVIFLLKTSLPYLILTGYGLVSLCYRTKYKKPWILLIPTISIFVSASVFGLQPNIRYALPVLPFMSMIIACGLAKNKQRVFRIIALVLFLWHIADLMRIFPHPIAYANTISQLVAPKYEILADSNLDWGQDLKTLRLYTNFKNINISRLAYFGTDSPDEYGFVSDEPFDRNTHEGRCRLRELKHDSNSRESYIAISTTAWHFCGFRNQKQYQSRNIIDTADDIFLIFPDLK